MPPCPDSLHPSRGDGGALPTPFDLRSQADAAPSLRVVEEFLRQPPHNLSRPPHLLQPEIESIYACGSYVSVQHPEAWSDLVRRAKHPPLEAAERKYLLSLVCGAFCELVQNQTPLLGLVEAVVAIPANPARLALRGMSLPEELGRAVQDKFGLPFLPGALRSLAPPDLQIRGMEFGRRPLAVKGSMAPDEAANVAGRTLLLIDDVVCSGSTLREAARLLLNCGGARVYAACLASCLTGPAL